MKRLLIAGTALTLATALVPQMVFARERPNYVVAKAGAYIPTGDLDDADYDPGFAGEIAYGRYLTPNLVIEGGAGYYSSEADKSFMMESGTMVTNVDAQMDIAPFTATLKGVFSTGPIDMFVGGGVGIYVATLEVEGDAFGGTLSDDDDDVVLGLHALAGAVYNINNSMFAGIEAKYMVTDEVDMTVFNRNYEYNLDGFLITGNFGIRF